MHLSAVGGDPFLFGREDAPHILVNNRILATANGKPISVIDVMKKMDMLFYKQYPQYTSNAMARFQFYKMHWKDVLEDLIDKELIIADAEENKLDITHGDIRKEMELVFGPNIIMNLDKAGITFDEAWQMVKDDLTIRRMVGYKAQLKAFKRITPLVVRNAYDEFAAKNVHPEEWHYQVISIRDQDSVVGAEAANAAHQYLVHKQGSLEDLSATLAKRTSLTTNKPFGETAKITVSELYKHNEKEMSPAYKEALASLEPNSYSKAISQKSRSDKSTVFRIFLLLDHLQAGAPPFQKVDNTLKQQLLNSAMDEETTAYLKTLREHYHVHESGLQELLANGFEPFVLK